MRNSRTAAADGTRLPSFITDLLDPKAYPHPVRQVELRQTHGSYVLLTGQFAYKIKKPVNFGFMDYSTIGRRRHFCHEEVRLNGRLCPDVYLGVAEVRQADGGTRIGAGGRLMDYAVQMVQLPEDRMMDRLLAADRVTPTMLAQVAKRLADFYRSARGGPDVAQYGDVKWVHFNTEENFRQTTSYIGRTISAQQYRLIETFTEEFIRQNRALFQRRIAEGFIREGHGDLRAENICFEDGLCILDCVEFNERLRCGDVASDIAFLAMDLDGAGMYDLSKEFVRAYVAASGDEGIADVLVFYKVYRAYVRGKVEGFRLDEPEMPEAEKRRSEEAARGYFRLAAAYVEGNP